MSPRMLELGPLEMQILGLLSASEPQSVSDIQSKLKRAGSDLAYTTVMTVLSRLFQKGHLVRSKVGRLYLYSISSEKDKTRKNFFDRVRRSLFQNDRLNPILALIDSKDDLTADELRELRRAVDEKLKAVKSR